MDEVRIVKAGVERIGALEPLWGALYGQHLSVDPDLPGIPMRSQDDSWQRRRRMYQRWLSEEDSLLFTAEYEGRMVGYALSRMHEAYESWDTHGRIGVLESIAVLPEMRSRGVGRRLMSALYAELRSLGVAVMEIGVLVTNEAAMRFYERQGFRPWLIQYLGPIPGSDI
jgi:ribosomal protein S18 acetylase RimI-like enzyme